MVALHVTPADVDDRAEVGRLSAEVQAETQDNVERAFVDQGYSGTKPAAAATTHGIELEVVKAPQAKRGFVLLPRRWVVERSFAWATRCRRLVKDYERYVSTLAGLVLELLQPPQLARPQATIELLPAVKSLLGDPRRA